jgi:hypothetical protein
MVKPEPNAVISFVIIQRSSCIWEVTGKRIISKWKVGIMTETIRKKCNTEYTSFTMKGTAVIKIPLRTPTGDTEDRAI